MSSSRPIVACASLSKMGHVSLLLSETRIGLGKLDDPIPYVKGDATADDVLIASGIERAAGLIAALPSDADNVFIALTAKGINRDIQVVACAERSAHGDDDIKASYCRLC